MKLKITLIMSGILALSGCGGSGDDATPPGTYTLPTPTPTADPTTTITDSSAYNDYGVHDPSVIKVAGDGVTTEDTYYVFGSHLDAAKTVNLQTWEMVSAPGGALDTSPLFDVYSTEAADGIAWTGGFIGSWAADVIQAPNGDYWFYYNHCAQDNPDTVEVDEVCWNRSYIGLASSSDIEGPYVNQGIFLRSGHTDAEIAGAYPIGTGITHYDQAIHPNAIDPAAFYDKDGNLWMVYGSYSGGIFVLSMDETTGMPDPDQGFGTHLVGGEFNAMEGAFVIYSPESDYYYLFWSNGGFNAADGYNIRVARSRTPDGPYLDSEGNDMVNARVANDMGTKLMGGFNFVSALGDTSAEWGYRSPGHNSALYDADLGKYLLFTHTRFPLDQVPIEQYHAVRIHEMWLNEDDWLVASPQRYAPVSAGKVDPFDLVGDYRLVLHGKDTNTEVHESYYVTLTEQGRMVTSELSGWYKLYPDNPDRITITVGGAVYEGVAEWQWDVAEERLEPVIAAISAEGETLWAQQLEEKSQTEVAADIQDALDDLVANTIPQFVKSNQLPLPSRGARGAQLVWNSAQTNFIGNDGALTRPNTLDGDQNVSLDVDIYIGDEVVASSNYSVFLPARVPFNRVAHYAFENDLTDSLMMFNPGMASTDVIGTAATPAYIAGQVGQAVNLDGTYGILLPTDLIETYEYTVSFWLNEQATFNFRPALFAAHSQNPERWMSFLPASWNGELMLWSRWDEGGFTNWFDALSGTVYPVNEWHHVAFSVNNGFVQVYYDGALVGTGNNLRDFFSVKPDGGMILTLGLNYWDAPPLLQIDELKFYDAPLSPAEIDAIDVNPVPGDQLIQIAQNDLTLGDLGYVITDIDLPNSGGFASAVTWVSSNPSVVSNSGVITRPARGQPDVTVTLTATITLGSDTLTKDFEATVISFTPPTPIARYSFNDDLTDSEGNFDEGYTVGPGIVDAVGEMTYAAGVVGNAISFAGGASNGAKLGDGLITDHSYGFGLWLNPTSLNQFTTSFFGYRDANNWISVVPFGPGGGNTMLWAGSSSWFDGNSGTQFPAGAWTHFAVSVNQGDIEIWVNGVSTFTASNFPDVFSTASPSQFSIGTNLFTQDLSYDGLMDELVIYGDPITQEEVDSLYAEGQ